VEEFEVVVVLAQGWTSRVAIWRLDETASFLFTA